jgi:hypothetical protein
MVPPSPIADRLGLLQENPFFVPPDELLLEIQERRERRPTGNRAGPEAE